MKTAFFLTLLSLCLTANNSNAQGNCTVSPVLTSFYQDDIGVLAVKYMLTTADSDLIDLLPIYYNEVAKGMAAIFNSTLPQRDSVFDLYCTHWTWGISVCKAWMIAFDPSYSWTTAWQNSQTVTGNLVVDNLFSAHQLSVTSYNIWAGMHIVTVNSNHILNYDALMDSLVLISGISWAEADQAIGTAGYLDYNKAGNIRHYIFTYQWNDCTDGCDNSHTWKFDVDTDCNVTFAGTSDYWAIAYEPLPVPTGNCFITGVNSLDKKMECEIYPNPFSNEFNIKLPDYNKAEIKIYDLIGRPIISQKPVSENTAIDFKEQVTGIYIAEIFSDNKIFYQKIIKN